MNKASGQALTATELEVLMIIKLIKQRVTDWASTKPFKMKIYLFGSHARNEAVKMSDIDIAMEFPSLLESERTLIMFDFQDLWQNELSNRLGKKVHIELFDEKTSTIKKGLEKSSVILFSNI